MLIYIRIIQKSKNQLVNLNPTGLIDVLASKAIHLIIFIYILNLIIILKGVFIRLKRILRDY
jgi:hypothetical protein